MSSSRAPGDTPDGTIPGDQVLNPMGEKLVLLVLAPGGIREFDLQEGLDCVVGRAPSAHITVDDLSVSREHARLVWRADGWLLEDLGSRNGTYVNDSPVEGGGRQVKARDTIRFGNVAAHLHAVRGRQRQGAQVMSPEQLDERIADEADRCVSFGRSLGVLTIESESPVGLIIATVRPLTVRNVRPIDAVARRSSTRLDILVAECDKSEAIDLGLQIQQVLAGREIAARIGIAVFPGDAPSAASLVIAADLALQTVAGSGVAAAAGAARLLQLGRREVIVADPAMVRLFGLIERVAAVNMPALVLGETGSGKEIVAEALHVLGPRATGPLVKLNCAAVPETLLEAELFGYERGAYSGALAAKPGLFEQAEGGTLLLDEIGEMSGALQAKLLRVLEDHLVRRLGAVKDREIDVRVVAATHRDLEEGVRAGRFREDLFYRLNAILLSVPPLRDRRSEIPLLAERFAAEAVRTARRGPVALAPRVLAALRAYEWPGNVRELRNVVSRAVVVCEGEEVHLEHIPPRIAESASHPLNDARPSAPASARPTTQTELLVPLDEQLRTIERDRIVAALDKCDGNQTKAAALLQLPRRTMVSRMAALGISGPRRKRE